MNAKINVIAEDASIFKQLEDALIPPFVLEKSRTEIEPNSFIVCDIASYQKHLEVFKQAEPHLLFVVSAESDEANVELIEKNRLMHLVGRNDGVLGPEILSHAKNAYTKSIWGLEAHLDQETEIKIISLSDSKNTNEIIQQALSNFNFDEYFSSPTEYLQVMANELISNSLYKGPNRRRQEQGLEGADRKSPVFLKGAELVQVTIGMDSKGVALSVQDSFGGLSYDTLIASLIRSFREKTVMDKKDGAGLGLYLTFLHSNQFIVNYRENLRTEVICIIEKNRRYKNYKQRIRSFHFCEEVKK
jgi:phosphoserine phosphatase RsbU/P